jgi:hypothetical protein
MQKGMNKHNLNISYIIEEIKAKKRGYSHGFVQAQGQLGSVTWSTARLDGQDSILGSGRDFPLRDRVHTGCGVHPAPYSLCKGG